VLVQPLKVAHSLSTNGFNKPGWTLQSSAW
jgi:hypothetical protein